MIFWEGMGFLVVVFVFACAIVVSQVLNQITGSDLYWHTHDWVVGISILPAAVLSWFVGKFLASYKAKILIEKETGKEIIIEPNHSLFFIKLKWWGPILAVFGLGIAAVDLMKLK